MFPTRMDVPTFDRLPSKAARDGRTGRWARGPVPLALVLAVIAGWRRAAHQPLLDLRFVYGLAMLPVLAAYQWRLRRLGEDGQLGILVTGYVAFELLVQPLHLYVLPFLNRFEHLCAFALLTMLLLELAPLLRGTELSSLQRLLVALTVWGVGWANEGLEYLARRGTPFFSEDTVLDLLMNTCAIIVVTLAMQVDAARAARHQLQ